MRSKKPVWWTMNRAENDNVRIDSNKWYGISYVDPCLEAKDGSVKSNASLIAAAPELLEACKLAKDCLYSHELSGIDNGIIFSKLQDAISKAEKGA